LIKPAGIDTPYTKHAKNYMASDPQLPPPVYAPDTVARAILYAAAHPERDIIIGSAGKMFSVAEKIAPRLTDVVMEKTMFRAQQQRGQRRHTRDDDALHTAGGHLEERGGYEGHVNRTSWYTQASLHPFVTAALLTAAGVAVATLLVGP